MKAPQEHIDSALRLLQDAGYLCLAPCPEREAYHLYETPPEPLFVGKVIDCETNGAHDEAKIFEIGLVTFEYDQEGRIYKVLEAETFFEDIQEELTEEVKTVTGRTNADIAGHVFDEERLQQLCLERPGIFIAHNAQFDRPKLERRFPWLQQSAWGCSLKDVHWMKYGQVDTKLRLFTIIQIFEIADENKATWAQFSEAS